MLFRSEATGTGAGIKLFCGGVGARFPDIADASRRMRRSEYAACRANGVDRVIEIPIGIDGIAFAEAKNGPKMALTPADLYRALAAAPLGKPNTARTWRDVNPSLPATPIQVYGPPSTSGTRDALAELILAPGCEAVEGNKWRGSDGADDAVVNDLAHGVVTIGQAPIEGDVGRDVGWRKHRSSQRADHPGILGTGQSPQRGDFIDEVIWD